MEQAIFKPRGGADGVAGAYLAWRLSQKAVVKSSGCWEWPGDGYATIDLKNWAWPERTVQLSRVAYMLCVGPIPAGLHVLHRCDNPPCIRPGHLFLGTNLDNIADKVSKGRQAKGQSVRKNHEHLRGEVIVTADLTAEQVMEIRRRDAAGESPAVIAPDFNINREYVHQIATGHCWKHLPLLYTGNRKNRPCPKCSISYPTRQGLFYRHVALCEGA